ncbi:hypothetical protein M8J75_002600 [Diaphorina citri]|nr:hypothetical protein M8J75_002600 [Diaphorina citri]KAI5727344.1 hypothetical protein M8J77_001137 [Diaphorina citri]
MPTQTKPHGNPTMSLHHQAKSHTNPTMSLQAKRRKHQPCPSSDPPPPIIQRLNPRPIYINSEGDSNSPICHGCHAPITGDLVKALGHSWHPEHFRCYHCRCVLRDARFHVHQGVPYCRQDYAELFLKKCADCGLPIEGVVVAALGQTWHRYHFVCSLCGIPLLNRGGYYQRDDCAFCTACFLSNMADKSKMADTAVEESPSKLQDEKFWTVRVEDSCGLSGLLSGMLNQAFMTSQVDICSV